MYILLVLNCILILLNKSVQENEDNLREKFGLGWLHLRLCDSIGNNNEEYCTSLNITVIRFIAVLEFF